MVEVTYVAIDGTTLTLRAQPGLTVMQTAVSAGICGIVAECGGNAICATCHVYVDEQFVTAVEAVDDVEDQMLDCTAAPRRSTSRLACQLVLDAPSDGLVVHLPDRQV